MQHKTWYDSPLGRILLAADEIGLCGLWFEDQKYFARGLDPTAQEEETALLQQAKAWLDAYFAGLQPVMDLPVHPAGTPFQQKIWQLLLAIPYGQTRTYKEIAQLQAPPGENAAFKARCIGQAIGRNPLSILVPCHRVVGTGQKLTGYAGGLERKKALLQLEQDS